MDKVIWKRCPECGEWCSAEKKGPMGRIGRLFTKNEDILSDDFAKGFGLFGQKGLGRVVGKAINYSANIFSIPARQSMVININSIASVATLGVLMMNLLTKAMVINYIRNV